MPVGDQSYLLTLAQLLRDGLTDPEIDPIADYRPGAMPVGWRRLWGRLRAR